MKITGPEKTTTGHDFSERVVFADAVDNRFKGHAESVTR
jgi:hypothetical protein